MVVPRGDWDGFGGLPGPVAGLRGAEVSARRGWPYLGRWAVPTLLVDVEEFVAVEQGMAEVDQRLGGGLGGGGFARLAFGLAAGRRDLGRGGGPPPLAAEEVERLGQLGGGRGPAEGQAIGPVDPCRVVGAFGA